MANSLDSIASKTGGQIVNRNIHGKNVQAVEYQVKGNGTKSTRYAYGGEKPDLTPHAKEAAIGNPVVNSQSLNQTSLIPLPTPPTPHNPGNVASGNNFGLSNNEFMSSLGFSTDSKGLFTYKEPKIDTSNDGSAMAANIMQRIGLQQANTPPDLAKIYKREERDSGLQQAKQEVQNYTSQINSIVAKAQADSLSLEGQGRGVPDVIIGGQQAQVNREAAIKALPLQALLANAQGNVELAQSHLDTMFQIKSQDAKAQYDYKNKLIDSVMNYADKQEERQFNELKLKEDRAYQETQKLNTQQNEYAKLAFQNGQSQLGAQIAQLDYKSPTFKTDLARLQSQIKDPTLALELELKRAQIDSANRANQPDKGGKIVKVNGVDYVQNADGSLSNPITPKNGQDTVVQGAYKDKINQIDNLIKSPALSSAVGPNILSRNSFGEPFTAKRSNFIADVTQITNQATIDTLLNIKKAGGTFGALSEKELALLEQSASKINSWKEEIGGEFVGYKTTETEFRKELANLKNHTQRLLEADGGINSVSSADTYLNTVDQVLDKTINDPYSGYLTSQVTP